MGRQQDNDYKVIKDTMLAVVKMYKKVLLNDLFYMTGRRLSVFSRKGQFRKRVKQSELQDCFRKLLDEEEIIRAEVKSEDKSEIEIWISLAKVL